MGTQRKVVEEHTTVYIKMKIFVFGVCLLLLALTTPGNGLIWVKGPQGEGDCNKICSPIPCPPRRFCKEHRCGENAGREAASDVDNVNLSSNGLK
eukprot:TRINITY_DN13193_c0_g1_i2.p1 TRINITY_DN13193_c0_g1~~TRINITY_DN13193_c0_g1_i2.p1  ORF type:complete len:111 (-),score=21.29 TRINITY_DN13193_c0_g1_i2:215-499(-)